MLNTKVTEVVQLEIKKLQHENDQTDSWVNTGVSDLKHIVLNLKKILRAECI